MPTATPFTALGRGNGFPFCPSKVNVSTYDYWTTFSGVNKNNPTTSDALIQESLALAMKFYWNIYSVNVTTNTQTNSENEEYSVSSAIADATPVERVCGEVGLLSTDTAYDGLPVTSVIARPTSIERLYNGVTTDEDNFVGYGAGRPSGGLTFLDTFAESGFETYASVTIGGYLNEFPPVPESVYNPFTIDYDYAEIDNFYFVCLAAAFHDPSSIIGSASASGLTATSTNTENLQEFQRITTTNAKINSFDFYTY
jgi:hypothetical protein